MENQCLACGNNFFSAKPSQLYCGCSRKCSVCETSFVVDSKAPNKIFCSRKCFGISCKNEIEKICGNCGKKWKTIASNDQLYCSRSCVSETQKKTIIKPCRHCGQDVKTTLAENREFCNKNCYYESRKRPSGRRKCTKCGEIKHARKFAVAHSSWCRKCGITSSRLRLLKPESRYKYSATEARRRCLEWEITFQEHVQFLNQPCHYCEGPLNLHGVGLDRLDNNVGYVIGNVVPCCGRCNRVRHDFFTYDEMVKLGKLIKKIDSERFLAKNDHEMSPLKIEAVTKEEI